MLSVLNSACIGTANTSSRPKPALALRTVEKASEVHKSGPEKDGNVRKGRFKCKTVRLWLILPAITDQECSEESDLAENADVNGDVLSSTTMKVFDTLLFEHIRLC